MIVISLVTVGLVIVDAPKVAVSPGLSGMFAGTQLPAVFQLFVAGAASHVCAGLIVVDRINVHAAATERARMRAGLTVCRPKS